MSKTLRQDISLTLAPGKRRGRAAATSAAARKRRGRTAATSAVFPKTYAEALRALHALAAEDQEHSDDAAVGRPERDAAWRREALDAVKELVDDGDRFDSAFPAPARFDIIRAVDMRLDPDMHPAFPANAVRICLQLAADDVANAVRRGLPLHEIARQRRAVAMTRDLLARYGDDFNHRITAMLDPGGGCFTL